MRKNKKKIKLSEMILLVLAISFAIALTVQIFLAGAATFINPVHWLKHTMFVHLFGFNLPIIMLIFVFAARLPRWGYWYIFSILIGIFTMYFTANITAKLPWFAAMHPVMAFILLIVAYQFVIKIWKFVFTSVVLEGD